MVVLSTNLEILVAKRSRNYDHINGYLDEAWRFYKGGSSDPPCLFSMDGTDSDRGETKCFTQVLPSLNRCVGFIRVISILV